MHQDALEPQWRKVLGSQFTQPYFKEIENALKERGEAGAVIYPPEDQRFSAFNATPFSKVSVVILGQDPYHGSGQAHGLSFSVQPDVKIPPSLRNIYKELESDLGITAPKHGFLQAWAERGVLLLNTSLSVEEGKAGAHAKLGWELFTDSAIEALSEKRQGLVFVLWGAHAQKKTKLIDCQKHLVLSGAHPSPLSAYRGFFGSKPFSKINAFLKEQGGDAIDWSLPALD
ncbi:uracil-DNA glycosylase [Flexibacterium corallicola]|uniref:uracil-DNA glycosylase n=1 Tax=Flexibacterium corallicola TaxID=3037259 RepID=UPI00286F12F7|nr:uracil-DNA glycosylase [Pseudovibrio sp. M1P-2-3]